MNIKKSIKVIIIVALILGELAVWTFPYEKKENPPFGIKEGTSIGIIGGADGPTSIYIDSKDKQPEVADTPKIKEAEDNGLLILVNKSNYLDKNYKPSDLSAINYYANDRSAECRFMRAEAALQFNKMAEASKKAGYETVMTTAYRSYDFQSALYNNYVANYGQAEADKFSAKPGYSEHQTGLAVDVSAPSVGYELTQEFDKTPEWAWLHENASAFGFIMRYPKDKTEITGFMYEPWHFRYVGIEPAKIIESEGLTLEEYIGKYAAN